jgi:hypothetical protein
MDASYLESTDHQFRYYKSLGEKAMAQVPDDQLFWHPNPESNSIAVIVKHMAGNMLSRWTDIFHTDGEKSWRDRDAEFINDVTTRADLMQIWEMGWSCLFESLGGLGEPDLGRIIYIRGEAHTVAAAINRQLAHYPYHIGQIVYISKMISEEWTSLSIPRNKSEDFNRDKFSGGGGDIT